MKFLARIRKALPQTHAEFAREIAACFRQMAFAYARALGAEHARAGEIVQRVCDSRTINSENTADIIAEIRREVAKGKARAS